MCIDIVVGREEPSFIAEASFVKAPLNSRVGTGAAGPSAKGKAKQESLDRLPLEIQESLILEDLLYVLMVRIHPRTSYISPTRYPVESFHAG